VLIKVIDLKGSAELKSVLSRIQRMHSRVPFGATFIHSPINVFLKMIEFSTRIEKFQKQGEKTGWTYIEISKSQAQKMQPGCRVSFRVKGSIDDHPIAKAALLPMGDGKFILPVNASIRKGTGKKAGDKVTVRMEADDREIKPSAEFIKCLKDDPVAFEYFKSLPKGHQNYFSKWIDSAKTIQTKTKRITMAVIALGLKQGYGEMMRANKNQPL
jgi:hypothetical protein